MEWLLSVIIFFYILIKTVWYISCLVQRRLPDWWERHIAAPYPEDIVESLCELLDLNINAGLGRRLTEAQIKQDTTDPNLFYIRSQDVAEAFMLAQALSVRAEKILHLNMRFRPEPILVC
jgi:hypothetical protein